jgi:DNA polymerase-3 subunit gamma/tau
MPYQSLYRKYRPQRFGELVGQRHVSTALRNAVRDDRVGHAYLFSGPRGTGKTTSARILAKALNCLDRTPEGDACGVCENCVGIAAGRFLDLFELDAASNNSVDDIRALTESVHLGLGLTATSKVYLIDEVHMLSANASNALLKTLEEPPPHVVFVLATTGPERVLPTIRSRTQHFEFTLYTVEELAGHLAAVCVGESVPADPVALDVIARAAGGSMRDALSLLEQAIAHGPLEAEPVAELFGGTGFELRMRILDALADEDVPGALVGLGALLDAGHDPRRVTEDLLATARDAFLLVSAKGRVRIDAPVDQVDRLRAFGEQVGPALLVRVLETLGQAVVDMRGTDAADPRLVLEIGLVRLARRDAGPPVQVLVERIERLEKALADGGGARPGIDPPATTAELPPRRTGSIGAIRHERAQQLGGSDADAPPPPGPVPPPALPAAETAPAAAGAPTGIELDDVVIAWAEILPSFSPATKAAAQNAQPIRYEAGVITFGVPARLLNGTRDRFKTQADAIRSALSERLGGTTKFLLEPYDGFEGGAPTGGARPAPTDGARPVPTTPPAHEPPVAEAPPPDDDEEVLDLSELVDADDADPSGDSVAKFTRSFDATVVEEVPRD